jgi:hypothetical protein
VNLRRFYRIVVNGLAGAGVAAVLSHSLPLHAGYTLSGATVTLVSGTVLSVDGDMILSHGTLSANSAQIEFTGNWTRTNATFDAGTSTVTIGGLSGSTTTLSGSTTFYSLQSLTAGKRLVFTIHSTQTVRGSFILTGAAANRIAIRSSVAGSYGYLINGSTNNASNVDVQDNNAGGGIQMVARGVSLDSGHNVNWNFGAAAPSGSATPRHPATLRGTLSNGGADFQLRWREVTRDESGNPMTVTAYTVQRSTDLWGIYAAVNSGLTLSYSESVLGQTFYYRVLAEDSNGNISAPSAVVDSASDTNLYVLPGDGTLSFVRLPDASNVQLQVASDGSLDTELTLTRQAEEETNTTLLSYLLTATRAATDTLVPGFSLTSPGMTLNLDYSDNVLDAGTQIAPYWINGGLRFQVASPATAGTNNSTLQVAVQNVGDYQLRVTQAGSGFRLQDGSPYPRILTPNRANENRRLFFLFENPNNVPVSITFYDIRNRKVREIDSNATGSIPGAIVWDVRDSDGHIVPSGVYLYKIRGGDETITGSVAVAR